MMFRHHAGRRGRCLCAAVSALSLAALIPLAPLHAEPGDTAETALAAARQAADAGRSAEAIAPYREALRLAGEERPDWRLELADQLTWSGRYDESIAEYRRVIASGRTDLLVKAQTGLGRALARRGDYREAVPAFDAALAQAPDAFEPAILRAQTLSWDNRQAEAEAGYRALLVREPGNERVLLGLARVQTWRGRQREALATLALLPARPADPSEAGYIAAEALQWMGRPDLALDTLEARLAADPDDGRAAGLKDRIARDIRHEARFDARRYDQSDGLDIRQLNVGADWRLEDGRARIGPRLAYYAFDPSDGAGDVIEVTRIGASGGYRISNGVDFNLTLGVDTIDSPGAGGRDDFLVYDGYVTFFPDDRWRIDIGARRSLLDSEPALRNRLVVEEIKGSVDHLPSERSRLTVRAAYADYSDGNRQAWWQAEFDQRLALEPRVHIALRYTGTDFTLPNQEGYFSPDAYHALEVLGRVEGKLGPRTFYGAKAGAGAERDVGQSDRFIVSGGVYLRHQLSDAVDLEAAYDYSSSSAASSTGFERGIGRISLVARF